MLYAELTDRDNKHNDCLAYFDTVDIRDNFIEETNERFGYEAWKSVSEDEARSNYDVESIYEDGVDCGGFKDSRGNIILYLKKYQWQ